MKPRTPKVRGATVYKSHPERKLKRGYSHAYPLKDKKNPRSLSGGICSAGLSSAWNALRLALGGLAIFSPVVHLIWWRSLSNDVGHRILPSRSLCRVVTPDQSKGEQCQKQKSALH